MYVTKNIVDFNLILLSVVRMDREKAYSIANIP